jgi:hypothetical protein
MKYVLILATGRSGSTTLMRIINTIPGTLIYGENRCLIWSLIQCHIQLNRFKAHATYCQKTVKALSNKKDITYNDYIDNKYPPMWYSNANFDNITFKLTDVISDIIPHTNQEVIGFKDLLRLSDDNIAIINKFIELFPDTKIIFNYRDDIESQSKSKWYASDINAKDTLKNMNKLCINLHNTFKEHTYLMEFSQLFNIEKVKDMFRFLGKELDESEYTNIINNNLDY